MRDFRFLAVSGLMILTPLCLSGISYAQEAKILSVSTYVPLKWYFAYRIDARPEPHGWKCINFNEPKDPDTWIDNYLCYETKQISGLVFSNTGKLEKMDCENIYGEGEPAEHTWSDNYLCYPKTTAWILKWSTNGPAKSADSCVRIVEPSDKHGWTEDYYNFLCILERPDVQKQNASTKN